MAAVPQPQSQTASPSLTGTLAGGNLVAPNLDPNQPALAPYDAQIKAAMEQLEQSMNALPNVDYDAKGKELLSAIQNRPTTPAPFQTPGQAVTGFMDALGAPKTAPEIFAQQLALHNQQELKKQDDIMTLKESLLHGQIQQEIQKGNFKVAMKQTEALEKIREAMDDRKRFLDTQSGILKIQQKGAMTVEGIKARVKESAASFHLPEKLLLQATGKALDYRKSLDAAQGLVPGTPRYTDDEKDTLTEQYIQNYLNFLSQAKPGTTGGKGAGSTNVPPAPAPNPGQERLDQAKQLLQQLRTQQK